jgi:hypothetical protein
LRKNEAIATEVEARSGNRVNTFAIAKSVSIITAKSEQPIV